MLFWKCHLQEHIVWRGHSSPRIRMAVGKRQEIVREVSARFVTYLPGKGFQFSDLFRRELAEFSRMHIQLKRTVAHALDLFHVMSDLLEHAPDLAILSFDQRDFVPRIRRFANHADLGRSSPHPLSAFRPNANTL